MPQADQRFRKHEHLRSPADFARVYDRRCFARADRLIVHACPNHLTYSRVGFSVSRKVGIAVQRNRLRRLYREAFRLARAQLPKGLDLVLIPRDDKEPSLPLIKETLVLLAAQLAKRLENAKEGETMKDEEGRISN